MTFVGPLQFRISYDSMNKAQKALIVGRCLFVVIVEGLVCVWPSLECTVAVPRHTWSVLGDQPAFASPPGRVCLLPFLHCGSLLSAWAMGSSFPGLLSRQSDKQDVLTTCRDQLRVPRLLGWRVSKQTSLVRGLCGQTSRRVPAGSQRQLAAPGLVDLLLGNGKGRQEWGVFGERGPQPEFSRFCGIEKAL